MAVAVPEKYRDLLKKRALALLATLMPDGSPQVTPVWFDYDGKCFRINTARGRTKDKNMRRDPRVAFDILDPDNVERYMQVRGRVVSITEKGAVEHMNGLALKYEGVSPWQGMKPGMVRVVYTIEPLHISTQG